MPSQHLHRGRELWGFEVAGVCQQGMGIDSTSCIQAQDTFIAVKESFWHHDGCTRQSRVRVQ